MNNNYSSTSSIISWTDRLTSLLRKPSYATPNTNQLRRSSRHPIGEIWKHIFSVCVYSDLEHVKIWSKNRRFVRLEDLGLSGVILYELPVIRGPDGRTRPSLTLEDVFGREENNYEDGMSIDRLIDCTHARLVYFPAYACTSFFIGQIMHAFLTDDHRLRPQPAFSGFFVYPHLSDCDEATEETSSIIEESEIVAELREIQDSEDSGSSHSLIDEREQADEKFDSSLDSFGPETPPRFDSPLIQDFATKHDDGQLSTILDSEG